MTHGRKMGGLMNTVLLSTCLSILSQFAETLIREHVHDSNNSNNSFTKDKETDFPITAVSLFCGGIILIIPIICLAYRCQKKAGVEELDVDENHVYGVYRLGEAYERQYSINEAVDNNFYY